MWTLRWRGLDAPRTELAHAELVDGALRARGTQLGDGYELRYEVDGGGLSLRLGGRSLEVALDGADFFDLETSPLFNSFPVTRYGMQHGGEAREFVMAWVSVPDLEVSRSEQRYEPLTPGLVRFRSGAFTADIELDEHGFVLRYPGLAERIG